MITHAQILTLYLDSNHPIQIIYHYPTNVEEMYMNSTALYPIAVSAGLLPDGIETVFSLWFTQVMASKLEMEYMV